MHTEKITIAKTELNRGCPDEKSSYKSITKALTILLTTYRLSIEFMHNYKNPSKRVRNSRFQKTMPEMNEYSLAIL